MLQGGGAGGGGERFSLGQSWEYLCMYVRSRYYMYTRREN